jgi:AbrB family looped-hinge helix DNA binding protein
METTIDRAGRVVIPKALRDSAGLKAGAKLRVECRDGKIEIEAVSPKIQWVRKGTLMVAVPPPGTPKMTVADVNRIAQEIRDERERKTLPPNGARNAKA